MAKDRLAPCEFYQHEGACTKGKEARHKKACQKCGKYKARKGFIVPLNKKKEQKIKGLYTDCNGVLFQFYTNPRIGWIMRRAV